MGAALKLVLLLPEPSEETRRWAAELRARLVPRPRMAAVYASILETRGGDHRRAERLEAARQLRAGIAFVHHDLAGVDLVVLASGLPVVVPR